MNQHPENWASEGKEPEQPNTPQPKQSRNDPFWLSGAVFLCVAAVIFEIYQHVTDPQMMGFLHDDGVYAITAKALAQGQGYRLLNLPGLPFQVKYPIFYPLILSLGWLWEPRFPQNLSALHGLTISFAALAIPLLYIYLRQIKQCGKGLAGLISLLVAANFHFIYYATSLMSEAPYFFFSLLTLWLAETGGKQPSKRRLGGIILASVLAFHTRTIGLALIGAITLLFLLRKQWKTAGLYLGITSGVTILPWLLWVKTHAMPLNALNYPMAYVYGGYGIEYGINSPASLGLYLQALMSKGVEPIINNLVNLLLPQVGYWLGGSPLGFTLLSLGLASLLILQGIRALRTQAFSASGLYIACYLIGVALWMYPNQAIRFSVVILPWLWLASFRAIAGFMNPDRLERFQNAMPKTLSRWGSALALMGIGAFLLWPSVGGYHLLARMRGQHWIEPSGQTAPLWADYQSTFAFLKTKTPPTAGVAGIWDPIFYLYTNHPGFGLFASSLQPFHGQVTPESFRRLHASLEHYGVQYIVVEPFIVNQQVQAPENPVATLLMQKAIPDFRAVYTAPHGFLKVYQFQTH